MSLKPSFSLPSLNLSLKARLTIFTVMIFIMTVWVSVFFEDRILRDEMQRMVAEQQMSTVTLVAANLNQAIDERFSGLALFAGRADAKLLANRARLDAYIRDRPLLYMAFNRGIFVTGTDGTVISSHPQSAGRLGRNYADRDYVIAAIKEGRRSIGAPAISKVSGAPVIVMAVPIVDAQGKVIGAVMGSTDLGLPSFLDIVSAHRYGKSGGYYLVAPASRMIITATDKRRIMETLPKPGVNADKDRLVGGFEGTEVLVNMLGVEVLDSSRYVPLAGWRLVASLPTAEAFAPVRNLQRRILLPTIYFSLLAGVLIWLMVRRQLAPMLAAVDNLAAVTVAGPALGNLPIARKDEVGQLIRAFNRLLDTIRQREDILQRTGQIAKIGGWELDLRTGERIWSQQILHMLEIDPPTSPPTHEAVLKYYAPEAWPAFEVVQQAAIQHGTPWDIEAPMITAGGRQIWARVQGEPLMENGRVVKLAGTLQDITERKRIDRELATQRDFGTQIINNMGQGLLVTDADERFEFVNPAFARLLGCDAADLVGKNPLDVAMFDDPTAYLAQQEIRRAGQMSSYEMQVRRADGGVVSVAITGVPRYQDGKYIGSIAVITDLTERLQADATRISLEMQLRESQKMQAIGTLAGGIAHDFNNILAAILGNAELARQDARGNAEVLRSVEEIRKAGSRGRDLVQQILSFSRRQAVVMLRIALADAVAESARLLSVTLPARLTLAVKYGADLPTVIADATQIQQVVINLVTNAMQAMPTDPGHIGIHLDMVTLDAQLAGSHPANSALRKLFDTHPGGTARLMVTDTGPGMDAATRSRIFEPFFTTKPVNEGTGLGLSVVHGIVEAHGGAIVVDSHVGRGTAFTIYLPLAPADANAAPVVRAPDLPAADLEPGHIESSAHILYVDDDESMLYLISRLLERKGFRVSVFADQTAALAALAAAPASFDLLVTDFNMPGMSGLDVARQARLIRADLPVAIASGFIDEALYTAAAGAGVSELIFKADVAEDFSEAVARLVRR